MTSPILKQCVSLSFCVSWVTGNWAEGYMKHNKTLTVMCLKKIMVPQIFIRSVKFEHVTFLLPLLLLLPLPLDKSNNMVHGLQAHAVFRARQDHPGLQNKSIEVN